MVVMGEGLLWGLPGGASGGGLGTGDPARCWGCAPALGRMGSCASYSWDVWAAESCAWTRCSGAFVGGSPDEAAMVPN